MIPCDLMGIPPPTQKFKSSNQDARTNGPTHTKSIKNHDGTNVFGEESPDDPSFPLLSIPGMQLEISCSAHTKKNEDEARDHVALANSRSMT
jgi:hypothetical protein